jgi:hypothetical protein
MFAMKEIESGKEIHRRVSIGFWTAPVWFTARGVCDDAETTVLGSQDHERAEWSSWLRRWFEQPVDDA